MRSARTITISFRKISRAHRFPAQSRSVTIPFQAASGRRGPQRRPKPRIRVYISLAAPPAYPGAFRAGSNSRLRKPRRSGNDTRHARRGHLTNRKQCDIKNIISSHRKINLCKIDYSVIPDALSTGGWNGSAVKMGEDSGARQTAAQQTGV